MKSYIWEQDNYRYILGVEGKKPLVFIGLNPSTATPKNPDATCCRLTRLLDTFPAKFDSLILLNLCPFVSTKTNKLRNEIGDYHFKKNIDFINEVLAELNDKNKELNILLGWGSGIKKRKYFRNALGALRSTLEKYKSNTTFYYIESENKLYPHHPLVFPKDIKLIPLKNFPVNFFNIACSSDYD